MRKMYSKEQIKALSIQSLKEAIESGEIEIPQPSILIVKGWMKDDEGDV